MNERMVYIDQLLSTKWLGALEFVPKLPSNLSNLPAILRTILYRIPHAPLHTKIGLRTSQKQSEESKERGE